MMQKQMVSLCTPAVPARSLALALALALVVILIPCLAAPATAQAPFGTNLLPGDAAPAPVALPAPNGYAETVYAEYAAGTGDRIAFEVETVASGRLASLAGQQFGDLVTAPEELVVASQFGTQLRNPRFVSSFDGVFDLTDLDAAIDRFGEVGYPLELGRYRTLNVRTTLGTETREHQAMELCWQSLGHCAVFDPAVVFLQSMVDNRVRLAAEGWGPRILEVRNPDAPNGAHAKATSATTAAVCGLASNPSVKDRSYYWGGYWVEYRDIFGITLVRKDLGSQRSGIRCDSNCNPQPYGYSNASSCYGTLGWNCACDNAFGYGTGGSSGKWIAESKCTHKFLLSARASASVSDLGSIAVDIYWQMDGGEDANGGQIIDTCGYF